MRDIEDKNLDLEEEDLEYIVKPELILEGERDTVLTYYDYEDVIVYRVEYWNSNKTGFSFGNDYDTFEEAFKAFKDKQYETKKDKEIDKILNQFKVQFDILIDNDETFLLRQTYRDKYNFYVVGFWSEDKKAMIDEKEFENDFEGAYKYFKSLQ